MSICVQVAHKIDWILVFGGDECRFLRRCDGHSAVKALSFPTSTCDEVPAHAEETQLKPEFNGSRHSLLLFTLHRVVKHTKFGLMQLE